MPRGGYAAMKQIHNPGFLRVAIIGLWVGAALLFFSAAVPTAHAFIKDIHERVTLEGLPFIKADVLEAIVSGNLDEDEGKEASFDERHAPGCRFRDHAAYVNRSEEHTSELQSLMRISYAVSCLPTTTHITTNPT